MEYKITNEKWSTSLTAFFSIERLRIMKLTVLLIILGIFQGKATSWGQDISISIDNASLEEVFQKIREQSGYDFIYTTELINQARPVSLHVSGLSVSQVLELCLANQPLTYIIENKTIVLREKKIVRITNPLRPRNFRTYRPPIPADTTKGTVIDEDGEPLIGVNVQVKGTNKGAATDFDGNFEMINVDDDAILVVSYIGYGTIEVPVDGRSYISIELQVDAETLDELVVVGYGTVKKSDLTGSVSSVSSEELTIYPALDAIQALQGMAAGVQVQSVNGEPGSSYKISIRGNTSINASSEPLIVVNGFPGATMPPPGDIKSMEILKDASSTAIYGSRGANGVVLITTKNGKIGAFKINFNSSMSFQHEIKRLEVLNASEYATYINEIDPGYYDAPSSYGGGTNWQDVVYRDGFLQNYQLSASGGSDNINYYISGTYYDHEGIIIGSGYKRYSFTGNIKTQVLDWVRVGVNVLARGTDLDGVNSQRAPGSSRPGVPDLAYKFPPTVGIYNPDGSFTITDRGLPADNPYANAIAIDQERISNLAQGNFYAELDLLRNLKFKSTFGVNITDLRRGQFYPSTTERGGSVDGEAGLNYNKHRDFISENYFTYSANFNDAHSLSIMGGYSYQHFVDEGISLSNATGFTTDAFSYWNLGAATGTPNFDSGITESELSSYYGRLNFGFNGKYLFTFNARYDGSSRFAKNKKWAFFPSGAFAWDMKDEEFMRDVEDITKMKFRISYGVTGNQAIRPYQSLSTLTDVYTTVRGSVVPGIRPGSIANQNLTWESTTQSNIGVDLELWNGRVNVTADYYQKNTSDLLFDVPVPTFSGFETQLQNIGKIQNKGFELSTGWDIFTGELRWNTVANISFNRNKILKLVENDSESNDIYYSTAPVEGSSGIQTQILREGEPVGTFYGFVYDGVLQEGEGQLENGEEGAGARKFKDLNTDGIIDDNDRMIVGDPHPDFIWGWNNKFSFYNFDLNILMQGAQGGDMINYTRMELGILNGRSNATKDALDRWTPTNTDTEIPRANQDRFYVFSDRWVDDGSYIRLKNISLGYNFSDHLISIMKLRSARIYVSTQNILTITNYKGVDPEVAYNNSNTSLGLDYASYPNTKSITVGMNLSF